MVHTDILIQEELYLAKVIYKIPAPIARRLNITNSNSTNNNVYLCSSADGFLNNVNLKATRCSHAGSVYTKQFHGSGNLQLLGRWFSGVNTQIGDQVRIDFISPTEILLTKKEYSTLFFCILQH